MMRSTLLLVLSLALSASTFAQDVKEESKEPAPDKKAMEQALKIIQQLSVRPATKEQKIPLIEHPLLTFGDAARKHQNGTLWAWGDKGRPVAVVELFRDSEMQPWMHGATLTSTERIVMTSSESSWTPEKTQIEFNAIPGAPKPAAKEPQRLRQIKELSRRFTAHEEWQGQRHQLRLLVQPVLRYADGKSIHDGALFVVAHGTNPELLLFIEAQGKSLEESTWHFGAAPSSSAELHLAIDEKEVWKFETPPNIAGHARDPYWMFAIHEKP